VTIQIRAGKPQVELIKDAFQLPADL